MKLTIRYFALLREAIGTDVESYETDSETLTVADVLKAMTERHPEAFGRVRRIRAAMNAVMVRPDTAVKDGAEIAFFPPVTGG